MSSTARSIGEKGVLLTPHGSHAVPTLLPEESFRDYQMPELETVDHYLQWTQSLTGGESPTSAFDYAGPLTEIVLLGTVASRVPGEKLAWDHDDLRFLGETQANDYVQQTYRTGWEVAGL